MEACIQCGDDFDQHVLVAFTDDPLADGGVMLCPRRGCRCLHTWGPATRPPSDEQLAVWWHEVQAV